MTPDLGATNLWLAIIAFSSLAVAVAVIVALVGFLRTAREAAEAVGRAAHAIEDASRHVQPLAAQASVALDEIHDLVGQLQRADDRATTTIEAVVTKWRRATAIVRSGVWPAFVLVRGASLLSGWLANRRRPVRTADAEAIDRTAVERFTYEGGAPAGNVGS
jgi:hypothetical protein